MIERDHYVYRAWDEFGVLLYIGCTNNPKRRWSAHKSTSDWAEFMHRSAVAGPFPRARALEIEAAAIREERPAFNALPNEGEYRRGLEFQRRLRQWNTDNPDALPETRAVFCELMQHIVWMEYRRIKPIHRWMLYGSQAREGKLRQGALA